MRQSRPSLPTWPGRRSFHGTGTELFLTTKQVNLSLHFRSESQICFKNFVRDFSQLCHARAEHFLTWMIASIFPVSLFLSYKTSSPNARRLNDTTRWQGRYKIIPYSTQHCLVNKLQSLRNLAWNIGLTCLEGHKTLQKHSNKGVQHFYGKGVTPVIVGWFAGHMH